MSITQGIKAVGDYTTGSPTNKATVDRLIALIPNPGVRPAQANADGDPPGAGFLDEMSPMAAVQLRVELEALKAAIENV